MLTLQFTVGSMGALLCSLRSGQRAGSEMASSLPLRIRVRLPARPTQKQPPRTEIPPFLDGKYSLGGFGVGDQAPPPKTGSAERADSCWRRSAALMGLRLWPTRLWAVLAVLLLVRSKFWLPLPTGSTLLPGPWSGENRLQRGLYRWKVRSLALSPKVVLAAGWRA